MFWRYLYSYIFIVFSNTSECLALSNFYGIVADYSRCIYWWNVRVDWFTFTVCNWISSQDVNVLLVGPLFPFPWFSGGCVFLGFNMFRHFHVIIREYYIRASLSYTIFPNYSCWNYFLKPRFFTSSYISSWIMAGLACTRQTSAIATSTKGLYVQPQTRNDCTRDCNVEKFYCKTTKYFNILIIW